MLVICPSCQTKNRVNPDALDMQVTCGHCKADLLPDKPIALTDATFQPYITGTQMPVVVDYWAEWCGPCRMMAPEFEKTAARMRAVRFVKVDTEANPRTSMAAHVRSIPTLALYVGGNEVARTSGAMSAADLERWITAHASQAPRA